MNEKCQKGGAFVEFLVVLPLLLMLMAAFVDFGIMFYNKQVLTNASREGARAGIVNLKSPDGSKALVSAQDITDIVENYSESLWNVGSAKLVTEASGVGLNYPADLTVRVTLDDYTPLLSPLWESFGATFGTVDLSAVTVMQME